MPVEMPGSFSNNIRPLLIYYFGLILPLRRKSRTARPATFFLLSGNWAGAWLFVSILLVYWFTVVWVFLCGLFSRWGWFHPPPRIFFKILCDVWKFVKKWNAFILESSFLRSTFFVHLLLRPLITWEFLFQLCIDGFLLLKFLRVHIYWLFIFWVKTN